MGPFVIALVQPANCGRQDACIWPGETEGSVFPMEVITFKKLASDWYLSERFSASLSIDLLPRNRFTRR